MRKDGDEGWTGQHNVKKGPDEERHSPKSILKEQEKAQKDHETTEGWAGATNGEWMAEESRLNANESQARPTRESKSRDFGTDIPPRNDEACHVTKIVSPQYSSGFNNEETTSPRFPPMFTGCEQNHSIYENVVQDKNQ